MVKTRFIVALLALMSGITAFSPVRAENAYQTFIGNWTCASDAGSVVQQTYALSDDGRWLEMRAKWNNTAAGSAGYFQNFYYRDAAGWWNTTSYGSNGWAWSGRSSGLKDGKLVFDGIEDTNFGAVITRETLTLRADGKMEHLWQMRKNGVYQTTSHAICTRQ